MKPSTDEARKRALELLAELCRLRSEGGFAEDEIAQRLGFADEEDHPLREAMYERFESWGIPGWVVRPEGAATWGESGRGKQERAARGTGDVTELPPADRATNLFRRDLERLARYVDELPDLKEQFQAGRFVSSFWVGNDWEYYRKSEFSAEQWRALCEMYGEDPEAEEFRLPISPTRPGGAGQVPREEMVALIAAHAIMRPNRKGAVDALIDALHPEPSSVDRADLYKERGLVDFLRAYAEREGYEVLEEVSDAGQSGASLERPGMDRVRDLVAEGRVSVVLAQDRDRFAREPAYHYLLKREFSEHGTKIRAMNDRGDESPEGDLTDGILDQLAKYERAKMVERSRRGKLRKAREGKVVAGHTPNYGFRFNASRDGYEVDEENMAVVRRAFRMVAVEGASTHAVARALELEGVPNPSGGRYWYKKLVKAFLLDDVYKPHSFEEVAGLVAPEVATCLDAEERYGVWWFNRRRTARTQVAVAGPEGREYKKKARAAYRDRAEWVAVPVPDPGVPREWVDAARDTVAGYRAPSKLGGRFWELSGALMRCGECGRAMEPVDRYYRTRSGKKGVICYYRCREANRRKETCANNKSVRSDAAHPAVWGLVSGLLSDPERLRVGLDAMIEAQRDELRDDPEGEAKGWLEKLAALDRKRGGYLDLAAEGLMGREELRAKLAELAEAREAAERRLAAVEGRKERVEAMERDREAVLEHFAGAVPGALDVLSPEERHALYKLLRLEVLAYPDKSLEVSGAILPGGGLHGRGEGDSGLDGGGPDGLVAGAGLGALDLTRT